VDMRYVGQSYELAVPSPSLAASDCLAAFHAAHEARLGHSQTLRPVEIINLRVKLVLPGAGAGKGAEEGQNEAFSPVSTSGEVWFRGKPTPTAVYGRDQLPPGS